MPADAWFPSDLVINERSTVFITTLWPAVLTIIKADSPRRGRRDRNESTLMMMPLFDAVERSYDAVSGCRVTARGLPCCGDL